jgi:uncharacterized membrane protein YhaH (DUF805 family)
MIRKFIDIFFNTITKKIFQFKDRSNRKEFFIFSIFEIFIFFSLYIYLSKVNGIPKILDVLILILGFLFIFIHFFASMSLTVRRLHDCGLSGWWYLLNFILSPFIFLILCLIKGDKNKNKYGAPPEE